MRSSVSRLVVALAACVSLGWPAHATTPVKPLSIAKQGYFYVGGKYAQTPRGTLMTGQMYVEFQIPEHLRHPYPIVMIHGQGQSGTNFTGTPDGRPGWAEYFLRQGYAVYVVDQPLRGRSPYHADLDGPLEAFSAEVIEGYFTHPEGKPPWTGAERHDQWPQAGVRGDPVFDQFYAAQLESSRENLRMDELNRDDGVALLEKIGPAIVLTHSRSGAFGWLLGDARPDLVKAVVAVEPWGPPFREAPPGNVKNLVRPWGLTVAPVQFSPPVADPQDLAPVQEAAEPSSARAACWTPSGPPRSLPKLAKVKVAVVSGDASYHMGYDHCTVGFLRRAGVSADWIRLGDLGIHGNGHMMMLEKNNQQIAGVIADWLNKTLK